MSRMTSGSKARRAAPHVADRTIGLQESVIREMTRVCAREGGINLSQGLPDVAAPPALKEAAQEAIRSDYNQYSFTYGDPELRQALAGKLARVNAIQADPETEITVTCGVSEGIVASCLAILNPGEEVVLFEPYYENYLPAIRMAGATPRFVTLAPPARRPGRRVWQFDERDLRAAFNTRTTAIILNNPMNPTGKVFTQEELNTIAGLCRKWNTIAITDEIYEEILYHGREHISLSTLDGMDERTITVMGLSKTYGVTGWRVGYVAAPRDLAGAVRKMHDYMTVCAPTPFQRAALTALRLPPEFYEDVRRQYHARRDLFCGGLKRIGFVLEPPEGAYYVLAGFTPFSREDDVAFAHALVADRGVASVPGSSFYVTSDDARRLIRFSFAMKEETLREALARIERRVDKVGGT